MRSFHLDTRTYRLRDLMPILWRCAPAETALRLMQLALQSAVPLLQVIATARFIDTALLVVGGRLPASAALWPALAVGGLVGAGWFLGLCQSLFSNRVENALRSHFHTALTERVARLSYACIESHETWDLIQRVTKDPASQMSQYQEGVYGLVSNVVRVLGLLVILLTHVWWPPLVILALSAPMIALALKGGRINYQAQRDVSKYERRWKYLGDVLLGREAVDERAMFGYSKKLSAVWLEHYERARKHLLRVEMRWYLRMKAGGVAMSLVTVVIAGSMLQPVMVGALSVGIFMSLVRAAGDLVQQMSWGLQYSMDQIAKLQEYMKDITKLVNLPQTEGADALPAHPAPAFESLELRDVSFRYPGTDRDVLKGLSLSLKAGRHYAFVGVNGAGKTTITKLMTGLYDQYDGEILLNGRSLRSYTQPELKAVTAVLHQDFARYSVSLRDNIALGDAAFLDEPAMDGRVRAASEQLGLSEVIRKLPKGAATPLGKLDGSGHDLSGGEWQRVAMARAVLSRAPLRVLDEPTAALDPMSESRLYEDFGRISQGVTTLFISHRLGSTKLADEIFVIGEGRLLEHGTHAQLMADGGLYARMYDSQRSWYQ